MQEYDLYINSRKPVLGLYVPKGASLDDFANPGEWVFDGTSEEEVLPASIVEGIKNNGHAFRLME